jgi:hypothetical protein
MVLLSRVVSSSSEVSARQRVPLRSPSQGVLSSRLLPDLLEKELLPGLRPVRLHCGWTDQMKRSDQETSPHTLLKFCTRVDGQLWNPVDN